MLRGFSFLLQAQVELRGTRNSRDSRFLGRGSGHWPLVMPTVPACWPKSWGFPWGLGHCSAVSPFQVEFSSCSWFRGFNTWSPGVWLCQIPLLWAFEYIPTNNKKNIILINVTGRIWPHSLGTLGYYPARYSLGFKSGAVDQFQSLFGTGQLFLCALGLLESSVEAVDQPDGHISREGETNGSLNSLSPWIESQNQQWDHMLLCRTVLKNEFGVSPLRNPPLRNVYKLGVNVIGRDPPFHLSLHSLPNADRKLPWTLWSHVYLFWRVTLTTHCGLYLGSRHQSLFWGGCRVCDY